MFRSIARVTMLGAFALILLIVISSIVLFLGIQELQGVTLRLSTTTISWIETSRSYDIAITSALASAQTFLVEGDIEELEQAEAKLADVDTALKALRQYEEAGNEQGGLTQAWVKLDDQRAEISDAVTHEVALLRARGIGDDEQIEETFDKLEVIEQQFSALNEQQASIRTSETSRITERIAVLFPRLSMVIIAICTLLTLTLIGMLIAVRRWIVQPLVLLTNATTAVAAGEYHVPAATNGVAEMGELQQRFCEMAELLAARDEALRHQVAEAEQARAAAEMAQQQSAERLDTIARQQEQIREMSIPILPIRKDILVMPLIGVLDHERLAITQSQALAHIERSRATHLLLDITGISMIDSHVAAGLLQIVQAAKLIGTQVILVGVRPEVAQTIVSLGLHLDSIPTFATLQEGLRQLVRSTTRRMVVAP